MKIKNIFTIVEKQNKKRDHMRGRNRVAETTGSQVCSRIDSFKPLTGPNINENKGIKLVDTKNGSFGVDSRAFDPWIHGEGKEFRSQVTIYVKFFLGYAEKNLWFGVLCRTAGERTWTSVFTKGRSFWSLTLLPNGSLHFIHILLLCALFLRIYLYLKIIYNIITSLFFVSGFCLLDRGSGFTDSNYTQLTDLYSKYKDKGTISYVISFVFRYVNDNYRTYTEFPLALVFIDHFPVSPISLVNLWWL